MLFAVINQALYMPIAVVIAAIISSATLIAIAIYNKRPNKNTDTHTPEQKPKAIKPIPSVETVIPSILLLLSIWRLCIILSDSSPITRSAVFGIVVFTGVAFICSAFLMLNLILYLLIKKTWKKISG